MGKRNPGKVVNAHAGEPVGLRHALNNGDHVQHFAHAAAREAVDRVLWFIRGGKDEERGRKPKLMGWEQDFPIIAPPVNRVLGFECREAPYLHWWSFLAAYYEIGDCLFAQVVSIRKKRAQGKALDKSDKAFARDNADLVNIRARRTSFEEAVIDDWI